MPASILGRLRRRSSEAAVEPPPVGSSPIEQEISEGSLRVHYQPIVDLHNREVFGYEALARSVSSRFANPLEMFQAALESNLCGLLGRTLREIAVQSCQDAILFLNLHPTELDQHWLVRPDDPLFAHGEPVYVEITEAVPMSHLQFCHSMLREIRGKGILLAVDDLGAGFSNLKYIADLDPEIVKLDRALVAGIERQSRLHKLLVQLVRLCTEMGAQVVAEGIETRDELSAVMDAGAHFGQGYLLARPAFPPPKPTWPEL